MPLDLVIGMQTAPTEPHLPRTFEDAWVQRRPSTAQASTWGLANTVPGHRVSWDAGFETLESSSGSSTPPCLMSAESKNNDHHAVSCTLASSQALLQRNPSCPVTEIGWLFSTNHEPPPPRVHKRQRAGNAVVRNHQNECARHTDK